MCGSRVIASPVLVEAPEVEHGRCNSCQPCLLYAPFFQQVEVPKHWPNGLQVCTLKRVLWLPPGWAQAWKRDSKGFKRKMFVPPEAFESGVAYNQSEVEHIMGGLQFPVDHNGHEIPKDFPAHWPNWLPRSWKLGFSGRQQAPCFRDSSGDLLASEAEAKTYLKLLGLPVKLQSEAAGPDTELPGLQRRPKPHPEPKYRRLRKMTMQQIENLEEPGIGPH